MMAARDMTECQTCQTMFADTDDTGVCPMGHETREPEDDDEYPLRQVSF